MDGIAELSSPDTVRWARRMRRRARLHRGWALCCGLLGLVLLVGAGIALAAVPEAVRIERAYHAARPCTGTAAPEGTGTPGTGSPDQSADPPGALDCVATLPAAVTATRTRRGLKGSRHWAVLAGPAPARGAFAFRADDSVLAHLRPGTVVSVTVWRGYALSLTVDGRTHRTARTPDDRAELDTALGLMALATAGFALRAAQLGSTLAEEIAVEGLPARLVRGGAATFWVLGITLCGFVMVAPRAAGWQAVTVQVLIWAMAPAAVTVVRRLRVLAGT